MSFPRYFAFGLDTLCFTWPIADIQAMYVLPRALESAWSSARKRAWVPIVPFGETILGAAAMAMVMDAYKVSVCVLNA